MTNDLSKNAHDNEISLDDCQRLISLFEKYPNKGRGKVVYNGRNEQIDEGCCLNKCIKFCNNRK